MFNRQTSTYALVTPPGATNVTAAAINDAGDITGFYVSGGQAIGFLKVGGSYTTFSYPEATSTTPFGINIHDQIVGSYTDSSGGSHGFLLSHPLTTMNWQSFDDPNGVGTTVINGVNDHAKMVGFYVDSAGNTNGMLILP